MTSGIPFRAMFSTLGCPAATLEEALELGRDLGFCGAEVRTLENDNNVPALLARRYGDPAAALQALGERCGRLKVLSTSFKLIGATDADRAAFGDYLPWAETLGVRWLRVFDGGRPSKTGNVDAALQTVQWWESIRPRGARAPQLLMETHDGLVTGADIRAFADQAPSVGILWDVHNTLKKSGEDIWHTEEQIFERLAHVHLKDSVSRPSARHPFTYVLPGEGEIPGGELIAHLRKRGYRGSFGLEWERHWHPYLPPLENAMRAFMRNWVS